MPDLIRRAAKALLGLGATAGQVIDQVLGTPAPKLIPIPVPAKRPTATPSRR